MGFFRRLFGGVKKKKKAAPVQVKKPTEKKRTRTAQEPAVKALPKLDDANRIVVIGDSTATALTQGLTSFYKRTPSVVISERVDDDIGLTDNDFYQWIDASDFTFVGDRVRAIVVSIGTFDRDDIKRSGGPVVFNSPEWQRLYRRRLVDMVGQLQLIGVPVIWMLPPPVINNESTQHALSIGALQTNSLDKSGFRIVDVSSGFTNRSGQYQAIGPNLRGIREQLRTGDGLGFTKSGQRKFAHYAKAEIDMILNEELDQGFSRNFVTNSEQVLNLTRASLRQNSVLSGGNGRARGFYSNPVARGFFVDGKALKPPQGRVDNFAWDNAAEERTKVDPQIALIE